MNVQQPPAYYPHAPQDQDDEKADKTSCWSIIQSLLILAALAMVITELVLALQDRGLAYKALMIATAANKTAANANDQVSSVMYGFSLS